MNWKRNIFIGILVGFLLGFWGGFSQIQNGPLFLKEVTTNAETVNQAEGIDGTCQWYLTQDGVLHIGAGNLAEPTSTVSNMNASQVGYMIAQSLPEGAANPTNSQATAAAMLVKRVVLDGKVQAPINSANLFAQMGNVTAFDNLSDLDTSQTTNMAYMFMNNLTITNIDWLTALDLSNFDTSKVTDMDWMFGGLDLQHIDLSSFDTSKVTSMMSMFNGDSNLQEANLSSFDGSSMKSGQGQTTFFMFYQNHSLRKVSFGPRMNFVADPFLGVRGYDVGQLPVADDTYTGKWQAVGDGSDVNPLGTKFDSAADIVKLYTENSRPTEVETYVWEPVTRQTRVTAKYTDENGRQIADDVVTAYGKVGENDPGYATEQLAIKGYTFDKVLGDTNGAYPKNDATVTYVYKKNTSVISSADTNKTLQVKPVTVQFLNENGQKVAPSESLTGSYGAAYQARKRNLEGYTLVKDSGNTTGIFTTEPQTVTYTYQRVQALKAGRTYMVVSSTKKIGLYRTKNFNPKRRICWYLRKSRTKWPMFIVTGQVTSNQGHVRYHVRDVNHGSATFGKTGYITAKAQYVVSTYYQHFSQAVRVLSKSGLNTYRQDSLKKKVNHYRINRTLKIKRIVHYHRTTRFQIANGQYISANKKLVKIVK
ncbi:MucBP domain-containing protein [Levilactobacillus yiduensis]|uniref:MucBP domain-containing protein n=1 Tax=Levilactobacillus yiduensis TaxID=2953880 RepID=UPI000EF34685|nr:MucBP domain-containing protein [Levilactobacillus yiduensis]AYM01696.1 BspA family leucine-rich repeat surface protein [Levilactobacillus brevis]